MKSSRSVPNLKKRGGIVPGLTNGSSKNVIFFKGECEDVFHKNMCNLRTVGKKMLSGSILNLKNRCGLTNGSRKRRKVT